MFQGQMRQNWSFLNQSHLLHVYKKTNDAFQEKSTTSTVKHRGSLLFFWDCFSASGTGNTESVQDKTVRYQNTAHCQNVQPQSQLQLKTPKNSWEKNSELLFNRPPWDRMVILLNIYRRIWKLQPGDSILQSWASWSRLLRKSGPNYLLADRLSDTVRYRDRLLAVIAAQEAAAKC